MAGVAEGCFARHALAMAPRSRRLRSRSRSHRSHSPLQIGVRSSSRSRSPRPRCRAWPVAYRRGGGCRVGSERIALRSEAFVRGKVAPSELEQEEDLDELDALADDAVIWGEHWTAYVDEEWGMWWHYDGPLGQMYSPDGHQVLPYWPDPAEEEVDASTERDDASLAASAYDSDSYSIPDEDSVPNAYLAPLLVAESPLPAAPPSAYWTQYLHDGRGTWWYYDGPLGHFWSSNGRDVLPFHAGLANDSDQPVEPDEQGIEADSVPHHQGAIGRPPRPPGQHWTEFVDDEDGSWWYYRGPQGTWWVSGNGDVRQYADVDDRHADGLVEAAMDSGLSGNHWTQYIDNVYGTWWNYEGPLGRWCQAEDGSLYQY